LFSFKFDWSAADALPPPELGCSGGDDSLFWVSGGGCVDKVVALGFSGILFWPMVSFVIVEFGREHWELVLVPWLGPALGLECRLGLVLSVCRYDGSLSCRPVYICGVTVALLL